jgi:competence protein ComEC
LIDTGSEAEFWWRIKPALAVAGVNRLSALVLSHGDDDHAGGAAAALAVFHPRELLFSRLPALQETRLLAVAWSAGTRVRRVTQGDGGAFGPGLVWRALWPPPGAQAGRHQAMLVLQVTTAGRRLLFLGDAPARLERQLLLEPPYTLLKVAHHGARTSSDPRFLARAAPQVAVIMPGSRNPFGHPVPEIVARLGQYAERVLDTKRLGAVRLLLDAGGVEEVQTWK